MRWTTFWTADADGARTGYVRPHASEPSLRPPGHGCVSRHDRVASTAADLHRRRRSPSIHELPAARHATKQMARPAFCLMTNHFHLIVLPSAMRCRTGCTRSTCRHAQRSTSDMRGVVTCSRTASTRGRSARSISRSVRYVVATRARRLWPRRGVALVGRALRQRVHGDSAGAHEQSGEASPPRPFSRR